MRDWVKVLEDAAERHRAERLYWVARGCCTEKYRKKCVERGLVPSEIVPMSEKDRARFRIEPERFEIKGFP